MKTWLLRIILMLQILGLVSLYAYHLSIEKTGKTYLLKAEPVDPRDLLSGDYVALRYTISHCQIGLISRASMSRHMSRSNLQGPYGRSATSVKRRPLETCHI